MKENKWMIWKGTPSDSLHRYAVLYLLAWIFGLTLELFLFLRPTPYGPAYVMDIAHYLPHAIFYMSYGLALITLPFMIVTALVRNAQAHVLRQRVFRTICASLLALSLLYQHIDNEILRFCNMHITPDFLRTYVLSQGVPESLWNLLADDAGGSNLSLYLLAVPAVFLILWFAFGGLVKRPKFMARPVQIGLLGAFFIGLVFLPALFRTDLFGSKNRQAKVAPPVMLIADAVSSWNDTHVFPKDIERRIADTQKLWGSYQNGRWAMTSTQYPFAKHYTGTCPVPEKPYNIIVVSFESFRAVSLKLFNESETIEAAPFLHSLATGPDASYYTHYYTNGHPTIGAFMAIHTSLLPHSSRTVAKAFTQDSIDSFPAMMRRHGYQAIFFGGSDPDWDNQRPWLMRWYDEVSFNPSNDELDRNVMKDMSQWLRTQRDASKPFVATAFLISNHMPFHLREENMRITDDTEMNRAILNTIHYDDDVLREFIQSIQNEPWFDQTIIVITGDHGLDLGDRGESPDYNNLRAEATQIPLVIYSKHPRMPHGRQDAVASHIDLGPTLLDLAGICDDNAFMGRSLIDNNPNPQPAIAYKQNRAAIFNHDYSLYLLDDNTPMLYSFEDTWQKQDMASSHPDTVESMKNQVRDISIVVDYCYQYDRFKVE